MNFVNYMLLNSSILCEPYFVCKAIFACLKDRFKNYVKYKLFFLQIQSNDFSFDYWKLLCFVFWPISVITFSQIYFFQFLSNNVKFLWTLLLLSYIFLPFHYTLSIIFFHLSLLFL